MTELQSMLAMVGTPVQWALVAAIAVLLFAPRLVPILARIAGRMVRREVHRRYGVQLRSAPRLPQPARRTVEPEETAPVLEERVIAPAPDAAPVVRERHAAEARPVEARTKSTGVWPVAVVVAVATAVLLWILLHTR